MPDFLYPPIFRQLVVGVDPHAARFDAAGDAEGTVNVAGEDAAAKAVFTVIRHGDDFLLGVERNDDENRSEYFFLRNPHLVVYVNEDCRLIEGSILRLFVFIEVSANSDFGTFFDGHFNIAMDLVALPLR